MATATKVRAKFLCQGVIEQGSTTEKWGERVTFAPVYSPDPDNPNHQWSQATPSGYLEMYITNPGAWGAFVRGQAYLIDIAPAD